VWTQLRHRAAIVIQIRIAALSNDFLQNVSIQYHSSGLKYSKAKKSELTPTITKGLLQDVSDLRAILGSDRMHSTDEIPIKVTAKKHFLTTEIGPKHSRLAGAVLQRTVQ
jgi:hypothetical protein